MIDPTHEDAQYSPHLADEVRAGHFRACAVCRKDTSYTGDGLNSRPEYDNALVLTITGGYGMFTDPQDDTGFVPGWTLVLCHECAHDACDSLPWLEQFINPHNSHSHTTAYVEAHPDHYGWDYDLRD